MIRSFEKPDLPAVMQIWLAANIGAHSFIPKEYWTENYAAVEALLPQAEVYVYEDDDTHELVGFIGLTGDCIDGLFTAEAARSKGIGAQLLNHAKKARATLRLSVYRKNERAVSFYKREQFVIERESTDAATNEKEFIMKWN